MKIDWLRVVNLALPAMLSVIPGMPAVLIAPIVQLIMEVQANDDMSGADKKAHVMREITQSIAFMNRSSSATVIDPDKVLPIVDKAIDKGLAATKILAA